MGIRTQPAHKRGRETTETPGVTTIMQPTMPLSFEELAKDKGSAQGNFDR